LRDDPGYASKAQRVSELTRDLVEVLANEPLNQLQARQSPAELPTQGSTQLSTRLPNPTSVARRIWVAPGALRCATG
jgi:glycolate oxidase iron-sulfur subunit